MVPRGRCRCLPAPGAAAAEVTYRSGGFTAPPASPAGALPPPCPPFTPASPELFPPAPSPLLCCVPSWRSTAQLCPGVGARGWPRSGGCSPSPPGPRSCGGAQQENESRCPPLCPAALGLRGSSWQHQGRVTPSAALEGTARALLGGSPVFSTFFQLDVQTRGGPWGRAAGGLSPCWELRGFFVTAPSRSACEGSERCPRGPEDALSPT